jgi:hypothetical protein
MDDDKDKHSQVYSALSRFYEVMYIDAEQQPVYRNLVDAILLENAHIVPQLPSIIDGIQSSYITTTQSMRGLYHTETNHALIHFEYELQQLAKNTLTTYLKIHAPKPKPTTVVVEKTHTVPDYKFAKDTIKATTTAIHTVNDFAKLQMVELDNQLKTEHRVVSKVGVLTDVDFTPPRLIDATEFTEDHVITQLTSINTTEYASTETFAGHVNEAISLLNTDAFVKMYMFLKNDDMVSRFVDMLAIQPDNAELFKQLFYGDPERSTELRTLQFKKYNGANTTAATTYINNINLITHRIRKLFECYNKIVDSNATHVIDDIYKQVCSTKKTVSVLIERRDTSARNPRYDIKYDTDTKILDFTYHAHNKAITGEYSIPDFETDTINTFYAQYLIDHVFPATTIATVQNEYIAGQLIDGVLEKLDMHNSVGFLTIGRSGAGKTTAMILYDRDNKLQRGIVSEMCRHSTFMDKYTKIDVTVVEIVTNYQYSVINDGDQHRYNDTKNITFNGHDSFSFVHGSVDSEQDWVLEGTDDPSYDDVISKVLMNLFRQRSINVTKNNMESSRSHCIATLTLHRPQLDGAQSVPHKFIILDFAGNEESFDCGSVNIIKAFIQKYNENDKITEIDIGVRNESYAAELLRLFDTVTANVTDLRQKLATLQGLPFKDKPLAPFNRKEIYELGVSDDNIIAYYEYFIEVDNLSNLLSSKEGLPTLTRRDDIHRNPIMTSFRAIATMKKTDTYNYPLFEQRHFKNDDNVHQYKKYIKQPVTAIFNDAIQLCPYKLNEIEKAINNKMNSIITTLHCTIRKYEGIVINENLRKFDASMEHKLSKDPAHTLLPPFQQNTSRTKYTDASGEAPASRDVTANAIVTTIGDEFYNMALYVFGIVNFSNGFDNPPPPYVRIPCITANDTPTTQKCNDLYNMATFAMNYREYVDNVKLTEIITDHAKHLNEYNICERVKTYNDTHDTQWNNNQIDEHINTIYMHILDKNNIDFSEYSLELSGIYSEICDGLDICTTTNIYTFDEIFDKPNKLTTVDTLEDLCRKTTGLKSSSLYTKREIDRSNKQLDTVGKKFNLKFKRRNNQYKKKYMKYKHKYLQIIKHHNKQP